MQIHTIILYDYNDDNSNEIMHVLYFLQNYNAICINVLDNRLNEKFLIIVIYF